MKALLPVFFTMGHQQRNGRKSVPPSEKACLSLRVGLVKQALSATTTKTPGEVHREPMLVQVPRSHRWLSGTTRAYRVSHATKHINRHNNWMGASLGWLQNTWREDQRIGEKTAQLLGRDVSNVNPTDTKQMVRTKLFSH